MKKCINKTNLIAVLFATTILSTAATAAVPKSALVKAEPVNRTQLTTAAHKNLKVSLTPAKVVFAQQSADSSFAKQKQTANQNKSITLTTASLIAE